MSTWVYLATKADLIKYAREFGLDTTGKVEELRQILSAFAKNPNHTETIMQRLGVLAEKHKKEKGATDQNSTPAEELNTMANQIDIRVKQINTPPRQESETPDIPDRKEQKVEVEILDRVRSWGIRYQGTTNPLEFISKMEEWAKGYGIRKNALIQTMPFILEGVAVDWWNTTPSQIRTWEDLREELLEYFLPLRYQEQLETQITQLRQRETEPTREYAMNLRKLMRFTEYSEETNLDRIYRNCRSKIKLYTRRSGFKTLTEFLRKPELAVGNLHKMRRNRARRKNLHKPPKTVLLGMRQKWNKNNGMLPSWSGKRQRPEQVTLVAQDQKQIPATGEQLSCDGFQIFAPVKIGPVKAKGTVDTGASRSVISKRRYNELRKYGKWRKGRTEITLANGSKQRSDGDFTTNIQFAGEEFDFDFLILNQVTGGILLGIDFLAKTRTRIQCGNLELDITEAETTQGEIEPEQSTDDTEPTEEEISKFLEQQMQVFEGMKGTSNITTHKIYMKDDRPAKQRYYPRNPKQQAIINEQMDELLALGLIEPSHSPYSAPVVLVKKKNNEWRMCVDYRLLNERTEKDAYPVPRMDFILNQLREAKFISTLDLKSGYWQIPMEGLSRQYTAFTVPGRGLFQWKVMPFGLTTAPATFQRALDTVIGPEMEPFAFAYLDDIVVIGRNKKEYLEKLREVFRRLQAANLKINAEKCNFFQTELKYLGHIVTDRGIRTDPEKVAAIRELPAPKGTKEVHSFLGMASW
ncbi:uncharacterized protein LOC121467232 [Drosophila elegans]|uniref:uncharacterized protein LOC121467232 n=1 Tax=Drosophila elegans TaxID=30023 RepID=UPI001BC85EA1|nr:uncharacterized protein LOC121467232 [Drosophila elegans]